MLFSQLPSQHALPPSGCDLSWVFSSLHQAAHRRLPPSPPSPPAVWKPLLPSLELHLNVIIEEETKLMKRKMFCCNWFVSFLSYYHFVFVFFSLHFVIFSPAVSNMQRTLLGSILNSPGATRLPLILYFLLDRDVTWTGIIVLFFLLPPLKLSVWVSPKLCKAFCKAASFVFGNRLRWFSRDFRAFSYPPMSCGILSKYSSLLL